VNPALRALPHLITFFRLLSAPVIVWLMVSKQYRAALVWVLLAGISDWLDGYTARKLKLAGQLGVVLDPLADKILLVTVFTALGILGLVPLWMLALAIGRDLVIVAGAGLVRILRGPRKFLPTMLGKVSTFFQIVLVLLALLYAAFPYDFLQLLKWAALVLSALFTALSGFDYVRIGIGMAHEKAGDRELRNAAQKLH